MRIIRAYYRWNLAVFDGITAALRRWPWLAVAGLCGIVIILQVTDAPLWFQILNGWLVGVAAVNIWRL